MSNAQTAIAQLTARIKAEKNVTKAATDLVNGIADLIVSDPAQVRALAEELHTNSYDIAQSILVNIPVESAPESNRVSEPQAYSEHPKMPGLFWDPETRRFQGEVFFTNRGIDVRRK